MRANWNKSHKANISCGASFIEFRDNEIKTNANLSLNLGQIIYLMTYGVLNLKREDISLIIHNLDRCPAIRSCIYSQLYQEFIFGSHGDVPAEDKFTDSLQLIEASYCSVYISGDGKHLKYAALINPSLEYKLVDNVIDLSCALQAKMVL